MFNVYINDDTCSAAFYQVHTAVHQYSVIQMKKEIKDIQVARFGFNITKYGHGTTPILTLFGFA